MNRCGYDVLFQDVDIVWFQDPLPYFLEEAPPTVDGFFMDDGARSDRFAPYPANSGFFFLRHNPRTSHLLETLLFVQDLVIQWGSHQSVFIQSLELHVLRHGLTVSILDADLFPGGYMFHHAKAKLEAVREGTLKPYIFHMNWTQYKEEKLANFKEAGMWYVDNGTQCVFPGLEDSAEENVRLLEQCCVLG